METPVQRWGDLGTRARYWLCSFLWGTRKFAQIPPPIPALGSVIWSPRACLRANRMTVLMGLGAVTGWLAGRFTEAPIVCGSQEMGRFASGIQVLHSVA